MSDAKPKKAKPVEPAPAPVDLPPVGSAARKALILQGVLKE